MREVSKLMVPAALMLLACGAAPEDGSIAAPAEEEVGEVQHPVAWGLAANDPLNLEHAAWHQFPCEGTPGARRCTNQGKEFLTFHRNYLNRLRAKHESMRLPNGQPRPESERTPWEYLQQDALVWAQVSTAARTAYSNLINNRNPNNGSRPFANEEEFGSYLENQVHNDLHGDVATAYPDDSALIGPPGMSPRSTFFFKIHGLVEKMYQRFQRSKLNDISYSNIVFRNNDNGNNTSNQLTYSPATGQVSAIGSNTLPNVPVDGCFWYMGAVADFDFDGFNDIVWHGPGCGAIAIWKMRSTVFQSNMTHTLPGVDGFWALIGSGDFNQDLRPDLVWANVFGGEVVVWYMNGKNLANVTPQTRSFALPSGFVGQLVGSDSVATTPSPPAIMARNFSTGQNRFYWFSRTGTLNSTTNLPTMTNMNWLPLAAGKYHPNHIAMTDIAWWNQSTGVVIIWAANNTNQFLQTGGAVTGTASSVSAQLQGAR